MVLNGLSEDYEERIVGREGKFMAGTGGLGGLLGGNAAGGRGVLFS